MPLYRVREDIFPKLLQALESDRLQMICTESPHVQRDQVTMYRGWEVRGEGGLKVIMWDKHRIDRESEDTDVELTVGTPNGRKGLVILSQVERALIALGAQKLA